MKICTKCNEEKTKNDFHKNKYKKDGLQGWCKPCKSEASSKRYRKSPLLRKKLFEDNKKKRLYIRNVLNRYKSIKKCKICKEDKYWRLSFHHEKDKELEISTMVSQSFSFKRIKKEMKKCVVLCHNCHSDLHHEQHIAR